MPEQAGLRERYRSRSPQCVRFDRSLRDFDTRLSGGNRLAGLNSGEGAVVRSAQRSAGIPSGSRRRSGPQVVRHADTLAVYVLAAGDPARAAVCFHVRAGEPTARFLIAIGGIGVTPVVL